MRNNQLEESLLNLAEHADYDDLQNKNLTPAGSFLKYKEHSFLRSGFILFSQLVFFMLGASFLSFPMWLNQIVVQHVNLSREDLSLLGGTTYISQSVCGFLIMLFLMLKLTRKAQFMYLTVAGDIILSLSWIILNRLQFSASGAPTDYWAVFYCMVGLGLSVGIYFFMWTGHILPLIHADKQYLFTSSSNIIFAFGATVSMSMKLTMSDDAWMIMMLVAILTVLNVAQLWIFLKYDQLFVVDAAEDASAASHSSSQAITKQFIVDSLLWRRNLSRSELFLNVSDVSSWQFYWMLFVFVAIIGVATTFMANLGPLLSSDAETDGSRRDQIIVLIVSTGGQLFGRTSVPIITHFMDKHMKSIQAAKQSSPARDAARLSLHRNRTTLSFTLFIGLLFVGSLIMLKFIPKFPFIVASPLISCGYGMMWCVMITFPAFFPALDFALLYCFMQFMSIFGTLALTLVVALMHLDNTETFVTLMVASLVTVAATVILMLSRFSSEPTTEMLTSLE
jgi:hypothetical protein